MATFFVRPMRRITLILAIGALGIAPPNARAAGNDEVVGQLKLIAREEAGSCERLLERAAAVVNRTWLDRPWIEVERELKAAGAAVDESAPEPYSHRAVLVSGAWNSGWGVKLDLYVDLMLLGGGHDADSFNPRVAWLNVGLTGKVSALAGEVRKQKWFGDGGVVPEGLASPVLADALDEFPILDTVDLSTPGEKEDSEAGGMQLPFGLTLQLDDRKGEWTRRRRIVFSANTKGLRGSGKRGQVEAYSRRDLGGRSALNSLAGDLKRLAVEKETSYQRLLWKATRLLREATLDRDWPEVAAALGLAARPMRNRFPGSGEHEVVFPIAADAFTTEAGQTMDLEIRFRTAFAVSRVAPTREVVAEAYVALRADVGKSRREVVDRGLLGEGTAAHLALARPETERWNDDFPIVARVTVSYKSSGYGDPQGDAGGFFVEPELVRTPGDASQGARPKFFFVSSLDPPQRDGRDFRVDDSAPFVPRDVLGDVAAHEGERWNKSAVSFSLTRKATAGKPDAMTAKPRAPGAADPPPAYGLGDLLALPPDTRAVRINSTDFYNDDLAVLGRFADLEVLDLEWADRISDASLERLPEFKKLRSVTIWGADGTGFRRLAGFAALRELNVVRAWQLTDEGINAIAELRQLTRLGLEPAERLTDRQLAELAKLAQLRELELSGAHYFDSATRAGAATVLQDLPSDEQPKWITEAGIDELAALERLSSIRFGETKLTDLAVDRMGRIGSLESIELQATVVTLAGLRTLSALPRLRRLTIESSNTISQADVAALKLKPPQGFEWEPLVPRKRGPFATASD